VKKELRLRRSSDIGKVLNHGRSWPHRLVVLCALPNDLGHNRYGFAASKRVGNAVSRNRAKRLMREGVRLAHDALSQGWDIVLIARQRLPQASYADLEAALAQLFGRAGLLHGLEANGGHAPR
jgi:ribonuclease P protein component